MLCRKSVREFSRANNSRCMTVREKQPYPAEGTLIVSSGALKKDLKGQKIVVEGK